MAFNEKENLELIIKAAQNCDELEMINRVMLRIWWLARKTKSEERRKKLYALRDQLSKILDDVEESEVYPEPPLQPSQIFRNKYGPKL